MKRFWTGAASALLAFVTGSAAGITPPNFDRQGLHDDGAGLRTAGSRPASRTQPARSREHRFMWADATSPALPLSPLVEAVRPEAAARGALRAAAPRLGLRPEAMDGAELRELHDLGHGPVIARFTQKYQGIEIFGRELKVVMDRNLRPVAYGGQFERLDGASAAVQKGGYSAAFGAAATYTPDMAVGRALTDLGRSSGTPGLRRIGDAPRPVNVWYADRGALVPAWKFSVRAAQVDGADPLTYGYVVSARDGEVLLRKNLTADVNFTYRAYADASVPFLPFDGPLGNARMPFAGATPADEPARVAVTAQDITLQNGPISTNDPWLASGATSTVGNNVDAYSDRNSPDGVGGDERAPLSGTRTFNYASTADADPSGNVARRAGIVNLFYLDNYLHDFWYDHGMNEAAGNAQMNNLGRGGIGTDPVHAETQDFSGRNNANMSTPPDGDSPVQQMYLFDGGSQSLTVTSPVLGAFQSGLADFGSANFDLSGDLAAVNDGTGTVTDGCESFGGVSGKIALIDRGSCAFVTKAGNAQAAGAIAALIVNNVAFGGAPGMSGTDPAVTIPVMSVSKEDGDTLKSSLGSGSVTVHMARATAVRDGALDNGVVAHEFFHYISNRLVGDAFGLINQQGMGMGEGWSDFDALLLLVRPDDAAVPGNSTYAGIYGLGLYVADSSWFGFRRAAYSTDMAVNPLTFQHIQEGVPLPTTAPLAFGQDGTGNAETHATGEIWANVLWECYAALLNDSRYTFTQARSRMMDYLIAGLKLTPDAPTMLEARDAILAAARATDAQDAVLFATAFAKRGMGVGAVGPDRYSVYQDGVTESYVAIAQSYSVTSPALDLQYDDGTAGYCDTDNILDPGETALLSFTVTSDGTEDLAAGATIQISTDGDVTLPGGGLVTLPALPVGATFDVSMPLTLASASSTGQAVTLTVAFPQAGAAAGTVIEPATYTRLLHVNADLQKTATGDNVEFLEGTEADWTPAVSSAVSSQPWHTQDLDVFFHSGHAWLGPDNGGVSTSTLTSPSFHINGSFSLGFDHYFELEQPDDTGSYFDAGVIEVKVDTGAWQDVTSRGGTFTGNGYNGTSATVLPGRQAFVDTNGGLESLTVNFGSALAGHDAQIRFRLETDEFVGAFGWVVDNLVFTGASAPLFSTAVAEDGACVNTPPVAHAGSDALANEGTTVNLAGTASDRVGGTLTYAWTRVSGPAVTISNASTLTPSFVAPAVSGNMPLTLRLTVSDGTSAGTDDVVITIVDTSPAVMAPPGSGGGGGAFGGLEVAGLGLMALLCRRRERRT